MLTVARNATDTICERPVRDKSQILTDVNVATGTLAFLAVLMRIFIAVRLQGFGYDDFFACLAGCMAVPHFVGSLIVANLGMGRDIWTVAPGTISNILKVLILPCIPGGKTDRCTGGIYEPACVLLMYCIHQANLSVLLPAYLSVGSITEMVLDRCWFDRGICRGLWTDDGVRMLADFR